MSLTAGLALSCAIVFSGVNSSLNNDKKLQSSLVPKTLETQLVSKTNNIRKTAPRWRQVNISESLSQLIRANAPHYWGYSKNQANEYPALKPYLKYEGIIAGDPHLGNFIIIPMQNKNGRTSLRYANFDLDDAGHAPFALDFAKLAIASKAITKEVSYSDMLTSYIKGLRGQRHEVPDSIKEITDWTTMKDYREHMREYIDERVDDGRFIHEGRVQKYNGKYTKQQIQELFPDMKVLDLARRIKESGGSLNAERTWILLKDKNGELKIFELKEWLETSLTHWAPQAERTQWLKDTLSIFDAETGGKNFRMVVMPDGRAFWVREKKYTLMDIPYTVDTFKEADNISYLADYAAYHLGRWHGMQAQAKDYLAKISRDPESFNEAIKEWAKDYLELAAEQL